MEGIETKRLEIVDWTFFVALLVVSLGIGIYSALRGRGSNSTQEYLVGGKQMSPLPVAISLLGGVISAISMLGLATEMYFFGTQLVLTLLGWLYGTLTVQLLILPILYPLGIVSCNEYISMRFGSQRLKRLASICSLFKAFETMGLYLYAPSLTLSTVTNLSSYASVIIMGLICTFYITIGGVKAVVYTDVVQTSLMFFGVFVSVIVCTVDLGSISKVFHLNSVGGRLEFFNMSVDPLVRHTFWSVQAQGFFNMIAWVGVNQPTFQRFISVKDLSTSKRLCTFYIVGLHALWLTFFLSGIVAYAAYFNCDPLTSGRIEKPDQILPYLVLDKLGHLTGVAGLFVAAVYGGVLSSLSSTGNSVACLIWEDFLKDVKVFKGITDAGATRVIKLLSAMSGLIGIGVGIVIGQLGSIMQVTASVGNAISGALSGIFITGMCAPWVNLKGAYVGYLVAMVFNFWLVIGGFMKGMGHPEKLPLSTDACPENLNVTILINDTGLVDNNAGDIFSEHGHNVFSTTKYPIDQDFELDKQETTRDIYHISYCYTGMLGIIVNLVISSIVSFFTGVTPPEKVDPRLVSPRCLRLYRYLWSLCNPSSTSRTNYLPNDSLLDHNTATLMIDRRKETLNDITE